VFQQEVASRREQVVSLQDDASTGGETSMRAHLLQLSNIWERVQELGDVRENKLAEALELVTATSLLPFTRSVSVSVSLQSVVRICCRRSQLRCNESNTTRPPQSLYCIRQLISESNFMQPHKQPSESEVKCLTFQTHGFKYPQDHRRSPSPLPKKHHIASWLGNHVSERSTFLRLYVDAVPSLRPSPTSGTLTSRALLAQASRGRMTSVGCRHPPRICVYANIRTVQTHLYLPEWSN